MTKKFQKLCTFEFAYDTKNKVRFNEKVKKGDSPIIGALYVDKKLFEVAPKEGDSIQVQLTELTSSTKGDKKE